MKKKIFIFQQREWANRIGIHLARKLFGDFELGFVVTVIALIGVTAFVTTLII